VIHTAFIHDFSKFKENCEIDRRVIEALGDALAGSNRPLIVTYRWPTMHRLDAGRLYRLALEKGSAGAWYHAVAEEGVDMPASSAKTQELLDWRPNHSVLLADLDQAQY